MDTLLGIGEFARVTGLSVSAVRFYAARGLVEPASVDPSNGYRWYTQQQVATGSLVRDLRRIGLSLAGIEGALDADEQRLNDLVESHIDRLESGVVEAREIALRLGHQVAASQGADLSRIATRLAASDFSGALEQVLPFAATNPEMPHLMTVQLEVREGSVRLVATDRYRMAVRDLVPETIGDDLSVVLAAATMQRWTSELDANGTVEFSTDGASFAVSDGPTVLRAPVVPAAFPDYERLLSPPESACVVVVDRSVLLHELERFGGDDAVTFKTESARLRLERGERCAELGARCSGPDVHVALNARYALDCAAGAIGPEIALEIEEDPLRPVVFRSATSGTYVSLLMPVKLD